MRPKAIFATDRSPSYLFLSPLTCRLWRRCGYDPVVMLVGHAAAGDTDTLWRVAREELERCGAVTAFVAPVAGYANSTLAQVSRLFAGALELPHDAWLLTADADMWPLDAAHFALPSSTDHVHILYANAYVQNGPFPRFPICYLGAAVSQWRDIMRIRPGNLNAAVREQLDFGLGSDPPRWRAWNYDEWLFGEMLEAWRGYPQQVKFHDRASAAQPPAPPLPDRLDRGAWREVDSLTGLVDAHVLHPAFSPENWPRLRRLLAMALPANDLEEIDRYHQRFTACL